eukprot:1035505-Amorphochlora_amoeboformis.AAC.1
MSEDEKRRKQEKPSLSVEKAAEIIKEIFGVHVDVQALSLGGGRDALGIPSLRSGIRREDVLIMVGLGIEGFRQL